MESVPTRARVQKHEVSVQVTECLARRAGGCCGGGRGPGRVPAEGPKTLVSATFLIQAMWGSLGDGGFCPGTRDISGRGDRGVETRRRETLGHATAQQLAISSCSDMAEDPLDVSQARSPQSGTVRGARAPHPLRHEDGHVPWSLLTLPASTF